jgi:hypothetical protein
MMSANEHNRKVSMPTAWNQRHYRTGGKARFRPIRTAIPSDRRSGRWATARMAPPPAYATAIRVRLAVNSALTSAAGNGGLNR